jgi:lysophospholipase L1-like esterase
MVPFSIRPVLEFLKGKPQPVTPYEFLRTDLPRPHHVVVMLGDSLTEGIVSANFVLPLEAALRPQGCQFINAGVSADLAYNLLQRSGEVIACCPDRVVILVGANDAQASASLVMGKMLMGMKNLPRLPDEAWFCENLRALVSCLSASLPECKVALMSLGTYGEDLSSPANRSMERFSARICEIAAEQRLDYLPLHERFTADLQGRSNLRALAFDDGQMMGMLTSGMILRRYLLRQSFDRIGAANRFHLLSDGLHFTERAANIVVELVKGWIRSS